MITLAGARNVFADCDGDYKQVDWEDVIAKNPDWIQLGVRNRGSEAANEQGVRRRREVAEVESGHQGPEGGQGGHFLRIGSEQTTIAGVGNADTVEEIAKTLYPGKVG